MRASGRSRGGGQCVYAHNDRGLSPRELLSHLSACGPVFRMTDSIPITRRNVSPERAEGIRARLRGAETLTEQPDASRIAVPADAASLFALLSDPAVHAPIYTLPRPLTEASTCAFIEQHLEEREAGTGLLFVRAAEDGQILGYSDVQVWPDSAARCTRRSTPRVRERAAPSRASTGCLRRWISICCARRPASKTSRPSACWMGWVLPAWGKS